MSTGVGRTGPQGLLSTPSHRSPVPSRGGGGERKASPVVGRKHGYRVTVQTGDVEWLGKDVSVYVQLVGDRGRTELTKICDRQFEADATTEFVLFAPSVGNIRKLYLKHGAELGGCIMEVKRAFVLNEELQRAWPFEKGGVLGWETKNEAIFIPAPVVCAGRRAVRLRAQELFGDSSEENLRDRLVKQVIFELHFFAKETQNFYVLGSTGSLGAWQPDRAVRMSRKLTATDADNAVVVFRGDWYLELETDELDDVEYKYVLIDDATRAIVYESELERKIRFVDEDTTACDIEGGVPDDDGASNRSPQAPVTPSRSTPISATAIPPPSPLGSERTGTAFDSCADEVYEEHVEYYEDASIVDETEAEDGVSSDMQEAVIELKSELERMHNRWWEEMEERRRLFNQLQELRGNVRVFCRVRPPRHAKEALAVELPDHTEERLSSEFNRPRCINVAGGGKAFEFDRVFSMEEDQKAVYDDLSALVISVLDGYNVCIFAYGQTGSGKTYTMNGTEHDMGVNYRALDDLFRLSHMSADRFETTINVAMLEIYNENLRDLLGPDTMKLEVKRGPEGTIVPNLRWNNVTCAEEVWRAMAVGSRNRASGATNMNEHSSRSHLVLCIQVDRVCRQTDDGTRAVLHLVDLAGSERLSRTNATGERLREAQHINKSLSALGDVFNAILGKSSHVPYRNSKLTYLLQDSLGGDAKTLMFVNVSPAENDAAETLSSLNFASRVSRAELGAAKRSVDSGESRKNALRVVELEREVCELRDHNRTLETELRTIQDEFNAQRSREELRVNSAEEDLRTLRRQLRETEGRATEANAYAEQNLKLHTQLRDAQERIQILESGAPQRSQPSKPVPVVSTHTSAPKHIQHEHPPTRSILAELNRAATEEYSEGPPRQRGVHQSARSSSRITMSLSSSIPRPRTSKRSSQRYDAYDGAAVKKTTVPKYSTPVTTGNFSRSATRSVDPPGGGFNGQPMRRGSANSAQSMRTLQRLTRPTISSSRSSSQPPTDDEGDSYESMPRRGGSGGVGTNFNVSTSLRKPERATASYGSHNRALYS